MDSCSNSPRVSEESEHSRHFDDYKETPSKLDGAKLKKSRGAASCSPDGTDCSTEDDSHAAPEVRTRGERPALLNAETTQRPTQEKKPPVAAAGTPSLLATKKQSGDPGASSSLVSESSEHDDALPVTGINLPESKEPGGRKPTAHRSSDGIHWVGDDDRLAALPFQSRDAQRPVPVSQATPRASRNQD